MSWFKRAYNISTQTSASMYAVTDPIEFYEWQYNGVIPKGTTFSSVMPRSDKFTDGSIIVTAEVDPKYMGPNGQLNSDIPNNSKLSVGEVYSPGDLMNRFNNLLQEFNKKINDFRINTVSQKYAVTKHKKPILYRISQIDENTARVESFGYLSNISEKLTEAKSKVSKQSNVKQGRSYEMSDVRKLENLLTYMENSSIPMDSGKYDFLVKCAGLSAETDNNMTWASCYINISPEGKNMHDRINKFQTFNWVRAIISLK